MRIGLFGLADSPTTARLISALAKEGVIVDVVFLSKLPLRKNLARVRRKLRSAGPIPTVNRIVFALVRRFSLMASGTDGSALQVTQTSSSAEFGRAILVGSYNNEEVRRQIRAEDLDLALAATDEILRRPTFSIPRLGTLNAHPGWAPLYRGLGSIEKMVADGRTPAVSVHYIDEGIDTGPILLRENIHAESLSDQAVSSAQARALAKVIKNITNDKSRTIDTFLEPSNLNRN
ncbi:MAG: formyltransferase family protein [Silicimonas sp.]|jgi:folate-dependent phosphoribosylglycinamide formyltransferase PurN|uniref:formyltransferase family protein n=1 Tax=Roseitalea porphyridii TaxID=1852022 RepID=UPI0032ECAB28